MAIEEPPKNGRSTDVAYGLGVDAQDNARISRIRRAAAGDCDSIVDLIAELRRDDAGTDIDRQPSLAAVRAAVESTSCTVLVAEADNAVLGFIVSHWVPFPMLGGTEAYISDLVVSRRRRGQGIGRRLVSDIEIEARRRGCVRVMLNNRMSAESFRRSFYPKMGFRVRDDFANFVKTLR